MTPIRLASLATVVLLGSVPVALAQQGTYVGNPNGYYAAPRYAPVHAWNWPDYQPTIADVNGRPTRGPGYNPAGSGSGIAGGGFEN